MTSMKIAIRKAGVGDLEHVLHHRLAMFEDMGHLDPEILERVAKHSEKYFREALKNGTYVAWLAVESKSGKVVAGSGLLIAAWPGHPGENRPERAWILNVYTEPEARRKGVAKQLMEVIIAWCRERGLHTVSLHASPAGKSLYESLGFQATNEMRLKL
jgi:GNAT superfamily N-acetyltransferase